MDNEGTGAFFAEPIGDVVPLYADERSARWAAAEWCGKRITTLTGVTVMTKIDKATAERWERQYRKGAGADEWAMFMAVVDRTGLNPDQRHIYLQHGKPALTIDGMRVLANDKGEVNGQDGPYWLHDDNEWHDFPPQGKTNPIASKIIVYRKGCDRGFTGVAKYDEFYPPNKAYGSRMIAKCAEADALRKAFAELLSGLYITEELDNIHADTFNPDKMKHKAADTPPPTIGRQKAAQIAKHLADKGGKSVDDLRGWSTDNDGPAIPDSLDMLPESDLDAVRELVRTLIAAEGQG